MVQSNKEKADLFNEHLADTFTPDDTLTNRVIIDHLDNNIVTAETIEVFNNEELKIEVSYLENTKFPYAEQMTPNMINELPEKYIKMLIFLFNAILKLQYWTKKLKIAEVILIHKPGKNRHNVSSHRSISQLQNPKKTIAPPN